MYRSWGNNIRLRFATFVLANSGLYSLVEKFASESNNEVIEQNLSLAGCITIL